MRIGKGKPGFAKTRSIIEAAFYGNNVVKINTLREAYDIAKTSPGTVVTDMPVYRGEEFGLDPEFMVKAHLLIPEGEENIFYNWMLNFQYMSDEYNRMYRDSKAVGDEPDIYIFSDPQWTGTTQTDICDSKCLCYFNTATNCAAILGMKYFGEHKKGTLTIGWAIANRNGYASCHGGQKEYTRDDGTKYVASVFGLSGSGKSTITHAKHDGKYSSIKVLHDDAFIINDETCASVALEPSYFDKTADYPTGCEDNKFLITAQNCSATQDEDGRVVLVTDDIRNGNGRAIKSKLWSPNRVDKIESPVNAIFWIMKDPTIPPVVKLKGAALASVMGATLATKRSTAERLAPGVDPNALVVEPYANPFRTYPLSADYSKFKKLVAEKNVDCFIINTGDFMGKKVQPKDTLGILETIVEGRAEFHKWGSFSDIEIMDWDGFIPNMEDAEYLTQLKARMMDRVNFVKSRDEFKSGFDKLPADALEAIQKVVDELK